MVPSFGLALPIITHLREGEEEEEEEEEGEEEEEEGEEGEEEEERNCSSSKINHSCLFSFPTQTRKKK